jgi:competence protein ComEA
MKPLLRGDRASSAVPARSSRVARFGAWARESLLARAIAAVIALFGLAFLGGSAVAGANGTTPGNAGAAPASANSLSTRPIETAADAGTVPVTPTIPTTRPELLPRAVPDPAPTTSEPSAVSASGASGANLGRATPDDPVDLNTARIEDLRRLPGVGAKRAEAILAVRARLPGGRFRQIEDLLKVKGVGRAMIKRLHPLVRFSGG